MSAVLRFWSELKRRNVFRAGLAWLALSWLSIEIAARLFPALGFPETAIRWLIIGFGFAVLPVMLFAWLFHLTPEGLRRDRGPETETPENARSARRTDQLIIVLILLALASSAVSRFVLPEIAAPVREAAAPVTQGIPRPMAPAGPVQPNSIAVLPFASLTPGGGDEWFALGMAEELLTVLARVEGLRVSSRTSSFAFEGSTLGAREIARRLGVAQVVDGSVQRIDDQIRVKARLVEAASDTLLWSETFDRQFSDVFVLQQEIAQAVTGALAESLGVRTVRVRAATADLEAYERYLRGRQLFAQRGTALPAARELLRQAVERDPQFAAAWATLAAAWYVSPSYAPDIAVGEAYALAAEAAAHAHELDPSDATALAVQARLAAESGERIHAEGLIEQALHSAPSDANNWVWRGLGRLEAGHIKEAHKSFARARELDPFSGLSVGWTGVATALLGDVQGGSAMLREAHGLGWQGPARAYLLKLALADGFTAEAGARYLDWVREDGRIPETLRPAYLEIAPGVGDPERLDEARAAARQTAALAPDHGWANLLLMLGMHDEALEDALRGGMRPGWVFQLSHWFPQDRPLRELPRYLELAGRSGLLEYWDTYGFPDHCQLVGVPELRLVCDR